MTNDLGQFLYLTLLFICWSKNIRKSIVLFLSNRLSWWWEWPTCFSSWSSSVLIITFVFISLPCTMFITLVLWILCLAKSLDGLQWKQLASSDLPNGPVGRSSPSNVLYRDSLVMYGGTVSTSITRVLLRPWFDCRTIVEMFVQRTTMFGHSI